jgi:peptidoglycan/xylan/chitin deacetylase (PgdA/CDA1 family)
MQENTNYPILLSFDLEEFDLPLEYGVGVAISDQIAIAEDGLYQLMDTLDRFQIKATFYTTVRFAVHAPASVQLLIQKGHELASHGLHHGETAAEDILLSREKLTAHFQVPVYGFRMPRMKIAPDVVLQRAGYRYHSSLHPTWIPGRYCHLKAPRHATQHSSLLHIPPSVTPRWRIPLFWLSFHHLPQHTYLRLCKQTLIYDGYLHLYFHPWEWASWPHKLKKRLPWYLHMQTGREMKSRFEQWIEHMLMQPVRWTTTYAWMMAYLQLSHRAIS